MSDSRTKHALDVIRSRRSHRSYRPDPVDRGEIEKLIDVARLAATARNVQPWHFVIVTEASMLRQLGELCDNGKFISHAPACIVVLSQDTKYYLEDGSAATQNILLAAEALNLGTCWVAGDKKPYARQVIQMLAAPSNMKLISLIAVGHSADTSARPAKQPLDAVMHWEKF